jgi:hypothetical protein
MEKCPNRIWTFPWTDSSPDVVEREKGIYDNIAKTLNLVFDWGEWKRGEKLFYLQLRAVR